MLRDLLFAFATLTAAPVGAITSITGNPARSALFHPLVGAALGLVLTGVDALAGALFWPAVAAAAVIAADALLTGGLHLDGWADTLDGLYGGKDRERALAIMKDSRVGALGVVGLVALILLKYSFLAQSGPGRAGLLLLMPVAGRQATVLAMWLFPYARSGEGLGRPYASGVGGREVLGSIALTAALVLVTGRLLIAPLPLLPLAGAIAVAILAGLGFAARVAAILGGLTGDVYGATIELGELAFLVIVSALTGVIGE